MPPLEPGDKLGPYVLDGLVGQGGMGFVFRAHDPLLGRQVALKVLRPDLDAIDPEALPRFLREARILASLKHPSFNVVYEAGSAGEHAFIALEWVDGTDLKKAMTARDLPTAERLSILRRVAEALAFVHAKGVTHRDVKPANVMVLADGEVKLVDFGLAKSGPAAVPHPMTFTTLEGAALGTPKYMAPEQLRGEIADARADQFAWGILAYELLAGIHPAYAMPSAEATFPFTAPRPLSPSPDVAPLGPVVLRALAPRADDRFGSMTALLAAWDDAMRAKPPAASPLPSSSSRVFVVSALLALIVGGVVLGIVVARRTTPVEEVARVAPSASPIARSDANAPLAVVTAPASVDAPASASAPRSLRRLDTAVRIEVTSSAFEDVAAHRRALSRVGAVIKPCLVGEPRRKNGRIGGELFFDDAGVVLRASLTSTCNGVCDDPTCRGACADGPYVSAQAIACVNGAIVGQSFSRLLPDGARSAFVDFVPVPVLGP